MKGAERGALRRARLARYQMYIDDMPMWALVGDYGAGHDDKDASKNSGDMYIWTHKDIDIGHNSNRVRRCASAHLRCSTAAVNASSTPARRCVALAHCSPPSPIRASRRAAALHTDLWHTHALSRIGLWCSFPLKIVDVNLTTGERQKLEEGKTISFTYSVKWKASEVNFGDRFDKYLDPTFFQHRVRKTTPDPG